jgi:hypothetical protein
LNLVFGLLATKGANQQGKEEELFHMLRLAAI